MSSPRAIAFAAAWVASWNSHDVERVLSHFSDDVVFTSPLADVLLPESHGVITGKAQLRDYWSEGLRRIPDLHFDVEAVYEGVNVLVIEYRNQAGRRVCEVLCFEGDVVTTGHATYLD